MIRQATKYDIPYLVEMMRAYAFEAPVNKFKQSEHHKPEYVSQLFYELIIGRGLILIDSNLNGMLVSIITPNIWCPEVRELKELAWWIKPECRNGTLGGKLWLAFNDIANEMLDSGKIDVIYSTLMESSPKINYEKRGFKKLETTFYKE